MLKTTHLLRKHYKTILIRLAAVIIINALILTVFIKSGLYKKIMDDFFYVDTVMRVSSKINMEPHIILAVITAESKFNPKARSHKDARGLMQIMNPTAAETAQNLKIENYDIHNEYHNILIGSAYLKHLMEKYSHFQQALHAYNAGMANLEVWEKFPETKNFVRKVNLYLFLWRSLLIFY